MSALLVPCAPAAVAASGPTPAATALTTRTDSVRFDIIIPPIAGVSRCIEPPFQANRESLLLAFRRKSRPLNAARAPSVPRDATEQFWEEFRRGVSGLRAAMDLRINQAGRVLVSR